MVLKTTENTHLTLLKGADTVIAELSKHPLARHLILGHNSLRDDGTIKLFKFLTTSRLELSEISLNSNGISDEGLATISEFLPHAPSLKTLFLQSVRTGEYFSVCNLTSLSEHNHG